MDKVKAPRGQARKGAGGGEGTGGGGGREGEEPVEQGVEAGGGGARLFPPQGQGQAGHVACAVSRTAHRGCLLPSRRALLPFDGWPSPTPCLPLPLPPLPSLAKLHIDLVHGGEELGEGGRRILPLQSLHHRLQHYLVLAEAAYRQGGLLSPALEDLHALGRVEGGNHEGEGGGPYEGGATYEGKEESVERRGVNEGGRGSQ
jgi:hypothetical protein